MKRGTIPGMSREPGWTFAFVCAIATSCVSEEKDEQGRTCAIDPCEGVALEVQMLGIHDREEIVLLLEASAPDLQCRPVRARGTIWCVPSGRTCGWDSIEEAEGSRQAVADALAELGSDAGADAGAIPMVVVDECACQSWVEVPCPH
jgi:hypothetical protein